MKKTVVMATVCNAGSIEELKKCLAARNAGEPLVVILTKRLSTTAVRRVVCCYARRAQLGLLNGIVTQVMVTG